MRTHLAPLATGLALILSASMARAEFEMWTNKDGKSAELEISDVQVGAEGTQVYFRTKTGKDVTLKLEDLAADAQARVKDWKERPPLKAAFAYATDWPSALSAAYPDKPVLQFTFDMKGEIALARSSIKISNPKLSAGGKELVVTKWSGVVDDGNFDVDPFATPPPWPVRKWSLIISAEGDFGAVVPASCEISADVEVLCGKLPKEMKTTMSLPKSVNLDDELGDHEEKTVEPFTIQVGTAIWPLPGKKDKDDGVVTGYHVSAVENPELLDLASEGGGEPIISCAFEVKGKQSPNVIYKKDVTNPATIVVKYWTEAFTVPLHLFKAASDKGRTAPNKP